MCSVALVQQLALNHTFPIQKMQAFLVHGGRQALRSAWRTLCKYCEYCKYCKYCEDWEDCEDGCTVGEERCRACEQSSEHCRELQSCCRVRKRATTARTLQAIHIRDSESTQRFSCRQ
mmetsp:Transcript_13700/g.30205  ORF Transcript_13700/g.30205 Transcript_13700/m.30205 type:complete len:118 (-) Transcript_13700:51-404(-)